MTREVRLLLAAKQSSGRADDVASALNVRPYLAERLVEAWQDEMARDMPPAGLPPGFTPGEEDLELLALRVDPASGTGEVTDRLTLPTPPACVLEARP